MSPLRITVLTIQNRMREGLLHLASGYPLFGLSHRPSFGEGEEWIHEES